jgi:hypothetical protein
LPAHSCAPMRNVGLLSRFRFLTGLIRTNEANVYRSHAGRRSAHLSRKKRELLQDRHRSGCY